MVQPTVKVEGIELLNQNFQKVKNDYPREVKDIYLHVAKPVTVLAARKVRSRTGRLAGSIKASATQKEGFVQTGNLPYAAVNHWGGYPGDYQGNPFLVNALEETEDRIVREWADLTDGFMEKVWVNS